ncbi:SMI1/KNR4 family protein [Cardiobacterium sp. Marseille-Q4385]|jgi:hypothetical protein|uniref:SMI1/KNR4 family protein n=1 Tax=Cardiobacterium sp. Marseille-Q4385 TaxID=2866573 RepID=UPI001CE3D2E8|nr:SMI1/KNR4 family protein [Cardiobacterium sp. Marseille-Q4385]
MDIHDLINEIKADPRCEVYPAEPDIPLPEAELPLDLARFYAETDGMLLYKDDPEQHIEIVGRRDFIPTNRSLYPDEWAETIGDIRRHWYLIARAAQGQYINIDLTEARHGECYDNRHNDRYAPAIAHNFTELLALLYHRQGDIWYWLYKTYRPNGDPHDMPLI